MLRCLLQILGMDDHKLGSRRNELQRLLYFLNAAHAVP
jgi:hypothetical protein